MGDESSHRTASYTLEGSPHRQLADALRACGDRERLTLVLERVHPREGAFLTFGGAADAAAVSDRLATLDLEWNVVTCVLLEGRPAGKLCLRPGASSLVATGEETFLARVEASLASPSPAAPNLRQIYASARAAEGPLPPPRPPIAPQLRATLDEAIAARDLAGLLTLFDEARSQAEAAPGREVEGNVILGAPQRYYEPSEAELALSETGRAVAALLREAGNPFDALAMLRSLAKAARPPAPLIFWAFSFERVDVVGSGRFIYPLPPEAVTLSVLEALVDGLLEAGPPPPLAELLERIRKKRPADPDEGLAALRSLMAALESEA